MQLREAGSPPPGWDFVSAFDDERQPEEVTGLEDENIRVQRVDGEGERVTIEEAWRLYSAEQG